MVSHFRTPLYMRHLLLSSRTTDPNTASDPNGELACTSMSHFRTMDSQVVHKKGRFRLIGTLFTI